MSRWIVASLLLAGLVACAPAKPSRETIEKDVRAASLAWDDAFARGDADALMRLYETDAISMPPGGPAAVGKAAIEKGFRSQFATSDGRHLVLKPVLHIDGDTAVERGEYAETTTPKAGGPAVTEEGKHIVVYHRQGDGSWKVKWEIWNPGR